MDSTTLFWLVMFITGPSLFVLSGLYRICRWWWLAVVAGDSDRFGGKHDWIGVILAPITLGWMAATIGVVHGAVGWAGAPVYAILTFFGPLTFLAGLIRLFGFGHTRLGRALGFKPPTPVD